MKPSKQSSESWKERFDESLGGEIANDIGAAHSEFCMSTDNCSCDIRYEQLKSFIQQEIDKARSEEREMMDRALVEMDELIKPLSGHCGQCDASIDGWNSAVDVIKRGLKQKLSITKSK